MVDIKRLTFATQNRGISTKQAYAIVCSTMLCIVNFTHFLTKLLYQILFLAVLAKEPIGP